MKDRKPLREGFLSFLFYVPGVRARQKPPFGAQLKSPFMKRSAYSGIPGRGFGGLGWFPEWWRERVC